jgi:hypothetical protein
MGLDASHFSILSQNNEANLDTFAHGTAPVPEPET